MQNLKFKQLLILSNTIRGANQFVFKETYNLITAKNNSVGKSTLVKLIFWAFGCEPSFDETWLSLDCKVRVDFTVGNNTFTIVRYNNSITLKEGNKAKEEFARITDFSKIFSDIVDFRLLLSTRTNAIETPPPAYYFIPYYIDQRKTWSEAWNNFEKLQQYPNWKQNTIKYHVGLLTPDYFDLEERIYKNSEQIRLLDAEIDKINTTLEVVSEFTPDISATLSQDELSSITNELSSELVSLTSKQEELYDSIAKLEADKKYLEQQKAIAQNAVLELDKDYQFAVENIVDDNIECPLCGTTHENSVYNRAAILVDKRQAEEQLSNLCNSLEKVKTKLSNSKEKLDDVKLNINAINEKYIYQAEGSPKIELQDIINSFATIAIQKKVASSKDAKAAESKNLENTNKQLKKDQKNLLTDEYKQQINDSFVELFSTYIKSLNAQGVNLSKIKSPLDYSKVIKEGGAAEGARAMLAYHLAIFSLIGEYKNEVKAPLVIDTPNQHEQSIGNYESIINLIANNISKDSQVFLCAMENEQLTPYIKLAKVITLDESRLLDEKKYESLRNEFL